MKKMVLWPALYLPNIGGLEIMTHRLALQLRAEGHQVWVLSNSSTGYKDYTLEGISVSTFPFLDALSRYRLLEIKQIFKKLDAFFDTVSPDLIHVHGWFESFCFYQARVVEKRKLSLYLTIHGLLEQKHYRTEACQKLWSMADGVSIVSESLRAPLLEQGLSHPNLQVIYNALPFPSKPLQALPPQQLLMIGRLTEEKGFETAFHALKQLLPKYPHLKLRLIGDGVQFEQLHQLKKELKLDAQIRMEGFIHPDEIPSCIDAATLVLIPSTYESFSLTALQAAQRGRPVVASRVYGLKEVVEDGKTGLLVEPQNPVALADAIDRLLSHPDQIRAMGEAGFERANRLFNIEITTQKYIHMYRDKTVCPLVSVIVPAQNGEAYIAEAIQSILSQDYPKIEILVVNNGSNDRTEEIVCSFPQVRYRELEVGDTALARNEGIAFAQGDYIAFLDQDDTWVSNKLRDQVQFLETHREYGAVIGLQNIYLEPGHEKPHWLKSSFLDSPQEGYLPSALMIRRSVLEATRGFDSNFSMASDVAWFLKAKHAGILIGSLDTVVVHRRIHGDNTSNRYLELQKQILRAIKSSLNERRCEPQS